MDDGGQVRLDDADEKPLTPAQARLVSHARLAAIFGAVIIFAGFALVLATIVIRLGDSDGNAGPPVIGAQSISGSIDLSAEETLISAATTDRYLTVTVQTLEGDRVIRIYGLESLQLIREIIVSSK